MERNLALALPLLIPAERLLRYRVVATHPWRRRRRERRGEGIAALQGHPNPPRRCPLLLLLLPDLRAGQPACGNRPLASPGGHGDGDGPSTKSPGWMDRPKGERVFQRAS